MWLFDEGFGLIVVMALEQGLWVYPGYGLFNQESGLIPVMAC